MGLFTEGIEEALSGVRENDAQLLRAKFQFIMDRYEQLLADNKILKEEMAEMRKRVEALENRAMDRVERLLK